MIRPTNGKEQGAVLIREFEVFSIPEPGTWALLLLGGFAFVGDVALAPSFRLAAAPHQKAAAKLRRAFLRTHIIAGRHALEAAEG